MEVQILSSAPTSSLYFENDVYMVVINSLGFIGAALLLGAYIQSSRGKWHGSTRAYQVANLFAGLSLTIYTYEKNAYFATFINIIWSIIALSALVHMRINLRKRSN